MSSDCCTVCNNYIITYHAIMRNMSTYHNQIIITYFGDSASPV